MTRPAKKARGWKGLPMDYDETLWAKVACILVYKMGGGPVTITERDIIALPTGSVLIVENDAEHGGATLRVVSQSEVAAIVRKHEEAGK